MTDAPKIIYTHTDEAPALATYSFLPIVSAFAAAAGVDVETRDISLAGRIVSQFPEFVTEEQCHEILLVGVGSGGPTDHLAMAQDRERVGDVEELVEPMRDVDDRMAGLAQSLDQIEALPSLGYAQGSRWFV